MRKSKDHVTISEKEAFLDEVDQLDPESRNLLALMVFAIWRRDSKLCDALDDLRRAVRFKGESIDEIDGALRHRLGRVCPEDEHVCWERALAYAEREGDYILYQGLVDLIERRVAS
jgi:hypothetical protein